MKIVENEVLIELLTSGKKDELDDIDEPLSRMYTNWLKDGNKYSPVGDVSVEDDLKRSAYRVDTDQFGRIFFERVKSKTAELYKFKSGPMEEVLSEIDKFWELKEDYKKLGLLYCRGLLLFGPPGSGKTSCLHQVVDMITGRGDVVFYSDDVRVLREGLKAFRSVEPDRKVVVILEDADEQVRHNEQQFLHLLDGQDSQDGVLYIGSTNYIERFPARLLRSGRFDKKIEVPQPPKEGRLVYLQNKLKPHEMETDSEIDRLASETEGMSFGDLLELVTAVYALKEPVEDVLERLRAGLEEKIQERDERLLPGEDGMLKTIPVDMDAVMGILPAAKSVGYGKNMGAGIDVEYLKTQLLKK